MSVSNEVQLACVVQSRSGRQLATDSSHPERTSDPRFSAWERSVAADHLTAIVKSLYCCRWSSKGFRGGQFHADAHRRQPHRMRVFSTVIHSWQAAPTFAPAPGPCAMLTAQRMISRYPSRRNASQRGSRSRRQQRPPDPTCSKGTDSPHLAARPQIESAAQERSVTEPIFATDAGSPRCARVSYFRGLFSTGWVSLNPYPNGRSVLRKSSDSMVARHVKTSR
jgi:hypothetical protein